MNTAQRRLERRIERACGFHGAEETADAVLDALDLQDGELAAEKAPSALDQIAESVSGAAPDVADRLRDAADALREVLADLQGEPDEPEQNSMPVASMYETEAEFRAAKRAWLERKANASGPSERRQKAGNGLGIVTGPREDD